MTIELMPPGTNPLTASVTGAASRLGWDVARRPPGAPTQPVLRARSTGWHPTARRVASLTASVAGAAAAEWVTFHEGGWPLLALFDGAGVGLAVVLSVVWLVSRHLVYTHADDALAAQGATVEAAP